MTDQTAETRRPLGAGRDSFLTRRGNHPTGVIGWLFGQMMAVRHTPLYRLTVEMLDVRPDDRVLDIGFGPGKSTQMLAERATQGLVVGIDASPVMVRRATRRNRRLIRSGRVELHRGSVERLPFEDGRFTRACEINSFHCWPAQAENLKEVRRVLSPGGLFVMQVRMRPPSGDYPSGAQYSPADLDEIVAMLHAAGFADVRIEKRTIGSEEVACILARCGPTKDEGGRMKDEGRRAKKEG